MSVISHYGLIIPALLFQECFHLTLNKQHNQTKEIIINVEYKRYCLNFYTYLTAFACISISATYRDIIILQKSDVKRCDYVFVNHKVLMLLQPISSVSSYNGILID